MNKLTSGQFCGVMNQYHKPTVENILEYGGSIARVYQDSFVYGKVVCITDKNDNVIESRVSISDHSIPKGANYLIRWIDPDYRHHSAAWNKNTHNGMGWYEVNRVIDFLRLARLLVEHRFSEYENSIANDKISAAIYFDEESM